jgi:epoxyqueuosine reductase
VNDFQAEITDSLLERGAALVGFADLEELPAIVRRGLPRALSIAVALDPSIIAGIAGGPTAAYCAEYDRANGLLAELGAYAANLLETHGHRAVRAAPTLRGDEQDLRVYRTDLPHKTVATRAGLGWIGKDALLITKEFGAAVRLTTVLTDAEFETGAPVNRSKCGKCTGCVDACPGRAMTGQNWRVGVDRDALVNTFACAEAAAGFAPIVGADPKTNICGVCIAACPWTQRYLQVEGTVRTRRRTLA